jgi:DNA mismatch endonuclease, patch repair protein
VVFTRWRVAVFVDGCFWHGCPAHGTQPRANADYWRAKIDRNVERDRETDDLLVEAGWSVVRVWEHVSTESAVERIEVALTQIRFDATGAD